MLRNLTWNDLWSKMAAISISRVKFLFLVTAAILNGGQAVRHNFERGPNLVQQFQRRFKCESLRCTIDGRWFRTPSGGKTSSGQKRTTDLQNWRSRNTNPSKIMGELMCSRGVSCSCSTCHLWTVCVISVSVFWGITLNFSSMSF